jgi:uncharacterized protein YfiM (DUF2279 family)
MIADRFAAGRERRARLALLCAALVALPSPARARDLWLAPDKALHFGATFLLASASYGAAAPLTPPPVVRFGTAAGVAMAVGLAKEMHDRTSGGDPSLRDLAWDAVGTATGLVVAWLVGRYLLR